MPGLSTPPQTPDAEGTIDEDGFDGAYLIRSDFLRFSRSAHTSMRASTTINRITVRHTFHAIRPIIMLDDSRIESVLRPETGAVTW